MQDYLGDPANAEKTLIRFYYENEDGVFDAVSYQKGSCVLHMLRDYIGDSAFFKGLNLYLDRYKLRSAEAHQLRLVFEEVSGRDLNWFFDLWFFGKGHPRATIDYEYNDAIGKVAIRIRQTQGGDNIFRFPLAIDIYSGKSKSSHPVWVNSADTTFHFNYISRPDLVNVDAGKSTVVAKK